LRSSDANTRLKASTFRPRSCNVGSRAATCPRLRPWP
jgi:hypothetical protein